jgi:catechol 2,3-dioxygenase-like lactoylglutathione lyase family enzyme
MNPLGQFFQVAIVVSDLDAAKDDLTRSVGLTWGETRESELGPWQYRLAFSLEGPPHIELIEAPEGSFWNPDPTGAMRIDHLQWWSSDIEADTARLEADGATIDVDGLAFDPPHPFRYFRLPNGLRIELIYDPDGSGRENYRTRWRIDGS